MPQVTFRVTREGSLQVQTNVTDKLLLLGLVEAGKFLLMTQPMEDGQAPLVTPAQPGMLSALRRMGTNGH